MKKTLPLLLCIALLTACSGEPSQSIPDELVVSSVPQTDSEEQATEFAQVCGVKLSREIKSCVSLSPAVTEIIAELSCADRIIGTSTYCDYPEELSAAAFGSAENPDIKGIIGVKPDALLTLSPLSERDIYALEAEGIAVILLEQPTDIEGYGKLYSDISACFFGSEAAEKTGEAAVDALKNAVAGVRHLFMLPTSLPLQAKAPPKMRFCRFAEKTSP